MMKTLETFDVNQLMDYCRIEEGRKELAEQLRAMRYTESAPVTVNGYRVEKRYIGWAAYPPVTGIVFCEKCKLVINHSEHCPTCKCQTRKITDEKDLQNCYDRSRAAMWYDMALGR